MSADYTPASTYHSTIQLPSDGDTRDAASIAAGLQAVADNTAFLNDNKVSSTDVATIAGPLTVNGTTTFNDDVYFEDTVHLDAEIMPDKGNRLRKVTSTLTNAGGTYDCTTDVVFVKITTSTDQTIFVNSTNSPQLGDEITIQLDRQATTTGKLNVKWTSLSAWLAQFDHGASADRSDNEASLTLIWTDQVGGQQWRVKSNFNFTILEASGP